MKEMKTFLNYVPLPMCGLILGLAALGNLLFIEGYATSSAVFFVIALVMMVPVLLKIMITPRQVLADLKNPSCGLGSTDGYDGLDADLHILKTARTDVLFVVNGSWVAFYSNALFCGGPYFTR